MQTVKQWLEAQGRQFPQPDSEDGSTSMAAYEAARLPMVVACTGCTMTMALTAERACDSDGHIFCADCAAEADAEPEPDRSPWVICTLCHGDGHHVNPAIDAGGLTREDFDDDPDFAEDYRRGVYDVPCARCGGSGKVREAELEAIHACEHERAQERRERALEDGDREGYLNASDPRWG